MTGIMKSLILATAVLLIIHAPGTTNSPEIGIERDHVGAVESHDTSFINSLTPVQEVSTWTLEVHSAYDPLCQSWMREAGITDITSASKLINGESGCYPHAVNKQSGACGIGQALPCSKMGCSLDDPVCQLRWMKNYVVNRYGSWLAAWQFWQSPTSPPYDQHWY